MQRSYERRKREGEREKELKVLFRVKSLVVRTTLFGMPVVSLCLEYQLPVE